MAVLVGGQLALVGVLGVQELVLGGSGRHCGFTTGMIGFHKRGVGSKHTLGKGHHVGIPNSNGEGQALGVGGGGLVTKAFHNLGEVGLECFVVGWVGEFRQGWPGKSCLESSIGGHGVSV